MKAKAIGRWFDATILELGRRFRWSYLPPLMAYFAAGVSGLAAIVGTFFVKEYLDLCANLALSASSLDTKYLNQILVVTREVQDPDTRPITVCADYGELGLLLINAGGVTVVLPLTTIVIIQHSPLRTRP